MIRVMWLDPKGNSNTTHDPGQLQPLLAASDLVWLDIVSESQAVSEKILREHFQFHPLAVDDALQESHIPKVDDWGTYLYLVLHAAVYAEGDGIPLETLELDAFLGRNFLVTHHKQEITAVRHVWMLCQSDAHHLRSGPARLLYDVADVVVAGYMPIMERVEDRLEEIEDLVFTSPSQTTLEETLNLKRTALHLRRVMTPQQELLSKLARNDYTAVPSEDKVYFRDLYDHVIRMRDIAEMVRDQAGSVVTSHLSMVNNRMNEVITTLTILTTLFMPISFIAAFFGMNFFQPFIPLRGWTSELMFLIVIAFMILLPGGMFLWARSRGWLAHGK